MPDNQNNRHRGRGFAGLLARIAAAVLAIAMLVVGFMFSVAIFAFALAVGAIVFGWLWWKVRRAVRQMREDPRFREFQASARSGTPPPRGDIIEGEVIREEWQDGKDSRRR